jgi:hypothetical protein
MKKHETSYIGVFGLVLALACSKASAATRTIQFAGVATTFSARNIPYLPQYIACSIIIANTGATDQYISNVTFNTFDSSNSNKLSKLSSDGTRSQITQEEIYNPPNATPGGPSCSNASGTVCTATGPNATTNIVPGGYYIATMQTALVNQVSFSVVPCAGSFTVVDAVPSAPGSMVASGAISFISEQAITGGQFMGAIYMSGTHISVPDTTGGTVALNASAFGDATNINSEQMQMNLNCEKACLDSGTYASSCPAICGKGYFGVLYNEDHWLPAGHSLRNFSGYLEEFASEAGGSPATSASRISSYPFHDNVNGVGAQNFRGLYRYANPHYAGGHVVEMIMGPFETICSGNSAYWNNGGTEFRHDDSVIESDMAVKISSPTKANKGPPERLYCAHAHDNDSPFGYVASSTSFAIWGGNAF